jgi:hypothetical protein
VATQASEVRELPARCLLASGTSHSRVAVMEVVVLGPFGNFHFGLKVLGLRFFDVGNLGWSVVVLG